MSRSSSAGPSQRQLRVGEQVRHAISDLRMSPDLKIATVFVSPLGAADDDAVIKALAKNAKFVRGRVSSALRQMKYMPEFRFRLDTSFDNMARIDQLLRSPEVARDLDRKDEEDK